MAGTEGRARTDRLDPLRSHANHHDFCWKYTFQLDDSRNGHVTDVAPILRFRCRLAHDLARAEITGGRGLRARGRAAIRRHPSGDVYGPIRLLYLYGPIRQVQPSRLKTSPSVRCTRGAAGGAVTALSGCSRARGDATSPWIDFWQRRSSGLRTVPRLVAGFRIAEELARSVAPHPLCRRHVRAAASEKLKTAARR